MMKLPLNVDFSEKIVVITGAGGVLCGDMAKAFAQAGAKVAALDLNEEAVKKLADECRAEGFICEGYKANVLEPEALEVVHQQVLKDLGPCDILVNGAGGNNPRASWFLIRTADCCLIMTAPPQTAPPRSSTAPQWAAS